MDRYLENVLDQKYCSSKEKISQEITLSSDLGVDTFSLFNSKETAAAMQPRPRFRAILRCTSQPDEETRRAAASCERPFIGLPSTARIRSPGIMGQTPTESSAGGGGSEESV